MKKLYVVDLQHTVYVVAENEADAAQVAKRGIHDFGDEPDITAHEVKGGPIPKAWADSLPFGSDDDKTVIEIMKGS